uniref:Uncharacterized protein n=1 Tax=Rhipicephalus microplus TaxID=6941 RepID=A0A6G5AIV7_RHIMP
MFPFIRTTRVNTLLFCFFLTLSSFPLTSAIYQYLHLTRRSTSLFEHVYTRLIVQKPVMNRRILLCKDLSEKHYISNVHAWHVVLVIASNGATLSHLFTIYKPVAHDKQ